MAAIEQDDRLSRESARFFHGMVDSVGVKRFAGELGLSTRQVNRILSGAQPNPVERVVRCVQCCDPAIGDRVVDFVCQEVGGYFVREEVLDSASVNAVKECAEAIAAISDGEITELDELEIREAVQALMSLARAVREHRDRGLEHPMLP
jgi:hypothetical protein